MKKGQVAVISAVMIVILVILAIILSGYLFYDKNVISVRESSEPGVFYFKYLNSLFFEKQYYEDNCCRKNTYIKYGFDERPSEDVVMMDNVYYVPECDCRVNTYIKHGRNDVIEDEKLRLEGFYYSSPCCIC